MNKKVKIRILVVLVFSIWGLIGYNIYDYLNPEIEEITFKKTANIESKISIIKKDTVKISSYRDPISGRIHAKTKKSLKSAPIINFPLIIYHGLIKANGKYSYLISVQNQQELLKIGASFQSVKLISATSTYIIVSYKKNRKKIVLKE
jgi:hypothetical protein